MPAELIIRACSEKLNRVDGNRPAPSMAELIFHVTTS